MLWLLEDNELAFAGRVAASLLTALELPELIVETRDEYERLAIELARQPERFADIRRKLDANRRVTPTFDTGLFTKHLETAYAMMVERLSWCRPEYPPSFRGDA